MNRRNFTKTCITCLSASFIAPLITACQATNYVSGVIDQNGISLSTSEFKKEQEVAREYVIVRNDALQFPIYLYRFSDNEYTALLMKCTHQGNELQAAGDHLHCSAHGSEFNNKGMVAQGPAEKSLRTFNVTVQADKIFIDLRA